MIAVPHETLIEKHPVEWFIERIGQIVFRQDNGCGCDTCKKVGKSGIEIKSQNHAQYLYDVQNEMGLNYFQK